MAGVATAAAATGLKIFFNQIHERNIGLVKLLLQTVLPVSYSEDFYKRVIASSFDFSKMAFYDDIFVGCVCGLLEAPGKKLYIPVIAVLAPYRDRGIGSQLMAQLLEGVAKHADDVKEIYLHVQTSNDDAVRFYRRLGFEVAETVENYYRGIDPPHCFVMRKYVNGGSAAATSAPSTAVAPAGQLQSRHGQPIEID